MSKSILFWSARARPRFGKVRRAAPGGKRRHAAALQTGVYTRGNDLSGTLEGAGGIGGLLERADGYNSSTGTWTNHNFYHADGNGNITYLVNSSQTLAASYRYDAFGNLLASSGTYASANTYRFSSKEFIPNAGLYYFLYRFYDPALQRWVNRDPLDEPGFEANMKIDLLLPLEAEIENSTFNAYLLVNNMAVNFVDMEGLTWWKPWTWPWKKILPPWPLPHPPFPKGCTIGPGLPDWVTGQSAPPGTPPWKKASPTGGFISGPLSE